MLDLRLIRDNPDFVRERLVSRGFDTSLLDVLIREDKVHRERIGELQDLQNQRNVISAEIGVLARTNHDPDLLQRRRVEVGHIKARIVELTALERVGEEEVRRMLAELPNLPADGVPVGQDETGNVELHRWGTQRAFDFEPKEHFELGGSELDFERAAAISGSRFAITFGDLARMERALGQYMLDLHVEQHGYTEVNPPLLVKPEAMFGTGQLPKFADDLFHTDDDRYLIPTAEVCLTNIVRDAIFSELEIERRYVALTPCFRAEAGSAGRDTRGMIRQHQFYKVELVSIMGETGAAQMEHERMLRCVEAVLRGLELPFRTMTLCTGDMGFGARKTYDVEVWLPGQKTYREISSVSDFGDFQGRRMNARYRRAGEKSGTHFAHTFNGSGVAVGRALVAVMENYQNADGSIAVPAVLKPYMGGVEKIGG